MIGVIVYYKIWTLIPPFSEFIYMPRDCRGAVNNARSKYGVCGFESRVAIFGRIRYLDIPQLEPDGRGTKAQFRHSVSSNMFSLF